VASGGQQYVGPFRLLRIIKTGKNSQVWAAINDQDQSRVAVKLLLEEFRRNREHLAFMKNEFTVGRALKHERVIRIDDYAVSHKIPYLVMEFFPYPNMKEVIQQQTVAGERMLDQVAFLLPTLIERAAEGLEYVHSKGWVHRDIKPDNFLVNLEGDVKLIDFALATRAKTGLAKLLARKAKVQGTRSYMSPEQILGKPLDLRSDVYNFGCTVFQLSTGRLPFTGVTSNDLLTKHLRAAPPAAEAYNRNLTPEFSELLQSTMAKRPKSRPADIGEFLKKFRSIQMFKKSPARPVAAADKESVAKPGGVP
jgi:serine/threonine protein kinase